MPATEAGRGRLHSSLVAVAGVPVLVECDGAVLPRLVSSRFPAAENRDAAPLARLNAVTRGGFATGGDAIHWHLADPDRLVVHGPSFSALVDLARGVATVTLDERELEKSPALHRAIEGIVYTLVSRMDRHPVHAATLRLGDAALVLHGPSGVGKSTLAYVAYRAGIGVLADDATRVQLTPELRVWGDGTPARIHLLEHVRVRFAELRGLDAERLSEADELKVVVKTAGASVPYARRPRVCLLSRPGAQRVTVLRAEPAEIHERLLAAPEAEMDLAPANRERVYAALAAPGGWHVTLSSRAEDAVPHLRRLLEEAAASTVTGPA